MTAVLLNHYPSTVKNATFGEQSGLRATVADGLFEAWALVAGQPEKVVSVPVAEFTAPPPGRRARTTPGVVETPAGDRWEIILGCTPCSGGNKLKSFNPFGGANRVGT